jgi:uncharacterized membrane protein
MQEIPIETLKRRFVKGEVTLAEYEEMLPVLNVRRKTTCQIT